MKLTKKTALYAAVLALAVLNGCSNVLLEKPGKGSGEGIPAGEAGAVPEGFGTVAIQLTSGAARTVMPAIELDNLRLEYWFTGFGGDAGGGGRESVEMTPKEGRIFVLEAGGYSLEIRAYADDENLVALGTTEEMFFVSAGAVLALGVNLRPAESEEGAGELTFTLEGPAGATVETLSLSRIAGEEATIELITGGTGIEPPGLSGAKSDIPAGYYLLRVVAKDSGGASAGRTAVAHIYRGLPTAISYVFIAEDFRMYRVSSADSTGPGTLREAINNAQSVGGPQTIQVALGPGAVIELGSALEIRESLTIEGNGATLTRADSWTDVNSDSQLLRITSTTAEVLIRRLHFKNGLASDYGGAVRTSGMLTLESCVFSGNRSNYGGAVYSNNALTVRGCTFYGNTGVNSGGAIFFNTGKTLTLTGNLFYGNTASSSLVAHNNYGAPVAASHNVVDAALGTNNTQAGWAAGDGDTTTSGMPVSGKTFKLLSGSEALDQLPETLPVGYPDTDFHGDSIGGRGAAGAVQALTANQSGYYYVEFSVSDSARGRIDDSGQDEDGQYPAGSLITAEPEGAYIAGYWLVNGQKFEGASLHISGHARARAVFTQTLTVTSPDDESGDLQGTLRHALTNAGEGDTIVFSVTGIELKSPLPDITKTLTIEGNGATLTRADSWSAYTSQLLRITDAAAEALIRRIHFKNGLSSDYGGAVRTSGMLTLESCVFSGNRSNYGGAVYSENTLTVRGCTFYGNTAGDYGGAIYFYASEKTLTLTGNLFYGNTARYYSAVYNDGSVTASHNVVDKAPGINSDQAGWSGGTDDKTISNLPMSPLSFRLLYGSGALGQLPAGLEDYPDKDFYGESIGGNGAAGAVQTSVTKNQEGYYYLELSANNNELGTVTVIPELDEDGLYQAGVNIDITANPTGGYATGRWLVNGAKTSAAPKNLSSHTWAQAIFGRRVMVNNFSDNNTPGTLRHALNNADDGDRIEMSMAGQTITLTSALPEITKSLTIEGNGTTLTKDASFGSNSNSQLLRITSTTAETLVRRVHFKNGVATDYGGAVHNGGILTLESCVFSDNRVTDMYPYLVNSGGAVYSVNTLTVRGCTFYRNSSYYGGAVYFEASGKFITLTGNLFYGNTASRWPVVRNYAGSVSASHNVVDVGLGTGNTQAGWTAGDGDKTFAELGIEGDPFDTTTFAPVVELSSFLFSAPEGFPTTDFNGATRTFPGAAGAVK